jgi:hypothetical protein
MNKLIKILVKILRWPENRAERIVPWFVILPRLLFVPFYYLGIFISYVSILLSYGIYEANYWVKDQL